MQGRMITSSCFAMPMVDGIPGKVREAPRFPTVLTNSELYHKLILKKFGECPAHPVGDTGIQTGSSGSKTGPQNGPGQETTPKPEQEPQKMPLDQTRKILAFD
jgi:hypothetical protein